MRAPKQFCSLCGAANQTLQFLTRDYLSGEDFQVVRCDGCALMFVCPQPAISELPRYYPSTHQKSAPAGYERMDAKPRVRMIMQLFGGRTGSILDVGCGKGLLLAGLRDQHWQVSGVELSEASCRYARELGLEICAKPLEQCNLPLGRFDVIAMFHSLEHMPAFGAVQSVLNKVLSRKNLLNDFNTGEYRSRDLWRSKHRWRDLVGLAGSWAVLAVGYPLFALAAVTLKHWVEGGTLRVVAWKPEEQRLVQKAGDGIIA